MADPAQIEQELRQYVDLEKNLSRQDRVVYLKAIFDKHFAMDKTDHIVIYGDLQEIIGNAKTMWAKTVMPIKMSDKNVHHEDVSHVLIMDVFINYLNRNKLLKKLVRFDITK